MEVDGPFRQLLHERLLDNDVLGPDELERTDLVMNLARFYQRLRQDSETIHRGLGWTLAGFRIMNVLWAAGPMESRRLTQLSGSSRAATSSALNTLERDGLIARDRSERDRRQVLVRLTEAGHERIGDGIRAQAAHEREWFDVLSSAEQKHLGSLLDRLASRPRT